MKRLVLFVAAAIFVPASLSAEMSGGVYSIYSDTLSTSGDVTSTGGVYSLMSAVGDGAATNTMAGTFVLRGGFLAEDKGTISFSLNSNSVDLGTLSTASVASGNVVATVTTDSSSGYTLSVSADGNLRSGAYDIDNVVDGSVSAGNEEYGIAVTGADSLISGDTAISGNVNIASSAAAVSDRQTTINFKASVSPSTQAKSYSQAVIFTSTVNP